MGFSGDLAAQKIERSLHQASLVDVTADGTHARAGTGSDPAVAAVRGNTAAIVPAHEQHGTACTGELNYRRAFAMSTFCVFMASVIYVPFFFALDKYIGTGRNLKIVLKKLAINQLLLSPFVDVPIYFAWTGTTK